MEFLGHLERCGDERAEREREEHGYTENQQREELTRGLWGEVAQLRSIAEEIRGKPGP